MKKILTNKHLITVFLLLFIFFTSSLLSSLQESPVSDEPGHIIAGLMYIKKRDLTFNSGSPLLSNVISSLPLSMIVSDKDIPSDPKYVESGYLHSFATAFLNLNSHRIDLLMLLSRIPSILLGVGVGIMIYLWSRKLYGKTAGIIGLTLFILDPNFIAHSHYATPDVALVFFFLLTLYELFCYLESKRLLHLIALILSCSAAQLVKNSAIYLFPIILLIIFIQNKSNRNRLIEFAKISVYLIFISWLSINLFYGFSGLGHSLKWFLTNDQAFLNSPYSLDQVEKLIPKNISIVSPIAQYLYSDMPLTISYDYLKTIGWVVFRSQNGQPSYLFGSYSLHGWWYYYPIILVLKETPIFLIFVFGSLMFCLNKKFRLRKYEFLFFILPSLGMLLLTMKSGIDTGIRQILFIIPLLIIFSTRMFQNIKHGITRLILIIIILIQAIFIHSHFPNYIGYFNFLAGNQNNNFTIATDSNIDWGQDVKKLSHYIKVNQLRDTKMNLFGVVNTELYDVPYIQYGPSWVKENNDIEYCLPLVDSLFAISATQLSGVYLNNNQCFSWLSGKRPVKTIGTSIFIYSL